MYLLGITPAAYDDYFRLLAGSYDLRMRVQITDLNQLPVADITTRTLDGQVTVDWDGEDATRAMSLTAFDPNYNLGFDNADGANGVWFLDRMVQVTAETTSVDGFTVECPIFTGPVRKFKRTGDVVSIDCVGKDIFARRSWHRAVLPKGTRIVDAIRTVLEQLGEAFFRGFDDAPDTRLAALTTVDRNGLFTPWGWARQAAASMGMRLYYDGAGYATLAPLRTDTPVFTFVDGDGGMVLEEPVTEGDYSEVANVVRAEGQNAPGNPYAEVFVDAESPLHPSKLLRNGKPMYMGVTIQRESITNTAQARKVASQELATREQAAYSTTFDSHPFYPLEERDCVRCVVLGKAVTFLASKFSFGFGPSAVMPVGYTRSVAPRLAQIRRM